MASWSQPELLVIPILERPVHPQLAAHGNVLHLVFNGMVERDSSDFPMPTDIYTMRREGADWSGPWNISGTDSASYRPAVAASSEGTVHVIWGEHTVNDGRRPVPDVTGLLSTSFRNEQWATPDTLWHGNGAPLGMVWRPVADSAGFVHVTFRPGGIDAAMGSVYFRRDGSGWTRLAEFRGALGQPGLNVDMAAAGDSLLLAVMVYGDPSGGESNHDFNSVFIRRSADHGVSWSPPERVLRAGTDRAHYPRVVATGEGRFHVVWLRDVDGDVFPDLVQHSHSVDGTCWSEPVTINASLPGMPVDKEVVADDRGGLHLVYRLLPAGLGEGPTRMIYVYWDGRKWSEPEVLFEGRTIGQEIGLARGSDGVLHLVVDVEVDGRRGLHYLQGHPTGAP